MTGALAGSVLNGSHMPFFAMQYRVLFHDTMAYGTHHHMTNFKFQNIARETILFDSTVNGSGWEEQIKDILMLTREAYSLNLAPVGLGGKVAILLSYEEPTRSTVRLCFRVMAADGQPVSCGYQTMILLNKNTHELVPAPPLLNQYLSADRSGNLIEKLANPSFAERLRAGSLAVKDIFPPAIRELGRAVASASSQQSYPKILDEQLTEYAHSFSTQG
jgi:acyl-CoA thioesterase FadM